MGRGAGAKKGWVIFDAKANENLHKFPLKTGGTKKINAWLFAFALVPLSNN